MIGATYDSVSFSVAAQETSTGDLFFSPDGLKMYTTGTASDNVNEYNLSTAWVVSSAVYSTAFSVASQELAPLGIFFRADGVKMYVIGSTSDTVFQYSLSTPWSVATASYDSISFSVNAQDGNPNSVFFKPNGLSMYIVGPSTDAVYQYTLSTAWNVSSATYLQSFSIAGQELTSRGVFFTGDGSQMFVIGTASGISVYNLSTPWNISTAAYVGGFSTSGQDAAAQGMYIKPDGTKMYIMGNTADVVYQYTVPSIDIQLTGPTSVAALDVQQDLNVYGKTTVANLTGFGGTVNLSGGKISFPAISSVSSGANTLDDYEEGSWTPVFTAATTNPSVTYHAARFGRYVKIGKTVFINLRVTLSAMSSAGSGSLYISGLPFTSDNFAQLSVVYRGSFTTNAPDGAYVESTNSYMNLVYTVATGIAFITTANLNGGVDIMISGFYTTTS